MHIYDCTVQFVTHAMQWLRIMIEFVLDTGIEFVICREELLQSMHIYDTFRKSRGREMVQA